MFIATLFIVDINWRQSKTDYLTEWIKKVVNHTAEYSTIKRNEIMIFGVTWMTLENIC